MIENPYTGVRTPRPPLSVGIARKRDLTAFSRGKIQSVKLHLPLRRPVVDKIPLVSRHARNVKVQRISEALSFGGKLQRLSDLSPRATVRRNPDQSSMVVIPRCFLANDLRADDSTEKMLF